MSEIQIDHEAAKEWADLIADLKGDNANLSRAYLDLQQQLAAERDMLDLYKKTVNHHSEVLSKFFQCGQKYNHLGSWGEDMVDAVPKLVEAYEAERARANEYATEIRRLNSIMDGRDNAHAQGEVG